MGLRIWGSKEGRINSGGAFQGQRSSGGYVVLISRFFSQWREKQTTQGNLQTVTMVCQFNFNMQLVQI